MALDFQVNRTLWGLDSQSAAVGLGAFVSSAASVMTNTLEPFDVVAARPMPGSI